MQLSLSADYACRVLIFLSVAERSSISEISDAYGISQNHLVKVVHRLSNLGFVETTRGRGGGVALARAPKDITVGEVVRKMEPHLDLVECFNKEKNTCVITPACGLKNVLSEATNAFLEKLDHYSFEDITSNRKNLRNVLLGK